jgi:hypothetical protein
VAGENAAGPRVAGWLRLVPVVLVAALIAAAAVANWRDGVLSLVFLSVRLKTGIVIIVSAAIGFVLGVAFRWSAGERQ